MEEKKVIIQTPRLILVVGIDLMKPAIFFEIERLNHRDGKGFFVSAENNREMMEKSLIV